MKFSKRRQNYRTIDNNYFGNQRISNRQKGQFNRYFKFYLNAMINKMATYKGMDFTRRVEFSNLFENSSFLKNKNNYEKLKNIYQKEINPNRNDNLKFIGGSSSKRKAKKPVNILRLVKSQLYNNLKLSNPNANKKDLFTKFNNKVKNSYGSKINLKFNNPIVLLLDKKKTIEGDSPTTYAFLKKIWGNTDLETDEKREKIGEEFDKLAEADRKREEEFKKWRSQQK